jgi:hypothetical protein
VSTNHTRDGIRLPFFGQLSYRSAAGVGLALTRVGLVGVTGLVLFWFPFFESPKFGGGIAPTAAGYTTRLYGVYVAGVISPDVPGLLGIVIALLVSTVISAFTLFITLVCYGAFLAALGLGAVAMVVGFPERGERWLFLSAFPLGVALLLLRLPIVGAGVTFQARTGLFAYAGLVVVAFAASSAHAKLDG